MVLFLITFLISAVIYNQGFKLGLNKSKNIVHYMALISILSGIASLLYIPFFKFKLEINISKIILLLISCIIYAIVDRINVYVRKNMDVSTYSIIKQSSNIFMIIIGFVIYKEKILLKKIIGIILILIGNSLVIYNKGLFKLNKVLPLALLANLLFTITLFINVNLSNYFSLPIYVFIILFMPGIIICIFDHIKIINLYTEFKNINKKHLIITTIFGSLMLIAQLKAYCLGNITLIAPLCTLTIFLNSTVSYFILNEKSNIIKKIVSSIIIILATFLIKS